MASNVGSTSAGDAATVTDDLLKRMSVTIAVWDEEDPRTDWWDYQADYLEARDRLSSAPSDGGMVGVPPGWKLVPVEPTMNMIVAGAKAIVAEMPEDYFATKAGWSAMLTAAPAPEHPTKEAVSGGEVERLRHKARGTVYSVIGRARLQDAAGKGLSEGAELVVYRGDDGQLWARHPAEMYDGRFELAALPSTSTTEKGE